MRYLTRRQTKRVLVDHAFIVAGGEITKAARNWIGNALDASKRSQIMFSDRDDILNLHVVANLPLPPGALPSSPIQFRPTLQARHDDAAAKNQTGRQHLFQQLLTGLHQDAS